jgi:hypothetical protein
VNVTDREGRFNECVAIAGDGSLIVAHPVSADTRGACS